LALKKHVKNTGIYWYSDGGISVFGIYDIDPLYFNQKLAVIKIKIQQSLFFW
jgi:hypothetical protein